MASVKNCKIKGGSQEMAVMVKVEGNFFNSNNSGQFVSSLSTKFTLIVVI